MEIKPDNHMKTITSILLILLMVSCKQQETSTDTSAMSDDVIAAGQSAVQDDVSQRNIVQVAVSSTDHSTLVKALQAAEYVDVLANAGPFTVFAPTNDAFAALPQGTLDDLLKPENKARLRDILEYHVYVGVVKEDMIKDEMILNQVNLSNATVSKKDGKITVNDANVLGTINTSNGIIYSVDKVLLPPGD